MVSIVCDALDEATLIDVDVVVVFIFIVAERVLVLFGVHAVKVGEQKSLSSFLGIGFLQNEQRGGTTRSAESSILNMGIVIVRESSSRSGDEGWGSARGSQRSAGSA